MTLPCSVFLRMSNVAGRSCRENQTHASCLVTFSRKSCRFLGNVEKYNRARQATGDKVTRRTRIAFWLTKAKDTHSEYVILIAFPRQQWLRERA